MDFHDMPLKCLEKTLFLRHFIAQLMDRMSGRPERITAPESLNAEARQLYGQIESFFVDKPVTLENMIYAVDSLSLTDPDKVRSLQLAMFGAHEETIDYLNAPKSPGAEVKAEGEFVDHFTAPAPF